MTLEKALNQYADEKVYMTGWNIEEDEPSEEWEAKTGAEWIEYWKTVRSFLLVESAVIEDCGNIYISVK